MQLPAYSQPARQIRKCGALEVQKELLLKDVLDAAGTALQAAISNVHDSVSGDLPVSHVLSRQS